MLLLVTVAEHWHWRLGISLDVTQQRLCSYAAARILCDTRTYRIYTGRRVTQHLWSQQRCFQHFYQCTNKYTNKKMFYSVFSCFLGVVWLCVCLESSLLALNWCNLVGNELNPVQWVNSKEPAFTWLSCCCYGREARQGRKNLPPFPFSLSQTPSLFLHSLIFSLPGSLAACKSSD